MDPNHYPTVDEFSWSRFKIEVLSPSLELLRLPNLEVPR